MLVTLWEDRAKQFQDLVSSSKTGPVFVVVTGLLAKKFSDAASLSSTDATRCYVNIDYAPLHALKEALLKPCNGKQADLPAPTMEHFLTANGQTVQELSISAILETVIPPGTQVVRCICHAKVVDVLAGNGWYYNCCPTCGRALHDLNGKFYCLSCDAGTPSLAQRFRIVVRVEDQSGSTSMTLFNKEAEQLVGIPLQKVLAEITEEELIPPVVRNIIGKHCAFQLKITPYNIIQGCEEYTVTRVSEVPGEAPGIDTLPDPANVETPISPRVNKKQKLGTYIQTTA